MNAGTTVAIVMIGQNKKILQAMKGAGAIGEANAATLEALGLKESYYVKNLARRNTLGKTADGKYYVTEKFAARRSFQKLR